MVFYKNFLEVNKRDEPEKYHICKDLEMHGKSITNNVDKKDWWKSVSTEIGHAAKKNNELLLPPLRSKDGHIAVISPNMNVIVKEEKITDIKSRFFFIRKL